MLERVGSLRLAGSLLVRTVCLCVVMFQYAKLAKLTHSSRISFDPDELRAMVAALHFIFRHSAQYDVDPLGVLFGELQQLGLPRDICSAIVKTFQQSKEMIRNTLRKEVLSCQGHTHAHALTHTRIQASTAVQRIAACASMPTPVLIICSLLAHVRCFALRVRLPVPRLRGLDWRVDYVLSSSYLSHVDTNNIRMQLQVQQPQVAINAESGAGAQAAADGGVGASAASPPCIPPALLSFSLTPAQFSMLYNDLKQAKAMLQHV